MVNTGCSMHGKKGVCYINDKGPVPRSCCQHSLRKLAYGMGEKKAINHRTKPTHGVSTVNNDRLLTLLLEGKT
jgi:hypothetical protein